MFRANIYSMEPLTPVAREAVNDGIGMVAAYMGETVVPRELLIRLPLNERGNVNPTRIGFGKLDKMVELHVMAVPLDPGDEEVIGLAGIGSGWSFVNTTRDSEQVIRATTSHEVAHALGFVTIGAAHADPESSFHCCDDNCLMHKSLFIHTKTDTTAELLAEEPPKLLDRIGFRRKSRVAPRVPSPVYTLVKRQYDFCSPCKLDIKTNGEKNLSELRTNRIFRIQSVK